MRLAAAALAWGLAMAASAWIGLHWREWESGERIGDVAFLFFACGLAGFPLAMVPAQLLARGWSPERRFALAIIGLATTTIGLTALAYAIQYRLYYSEWHDHAFTIRWIFEVGFTTLAAIYQFAVMGMRLFLPVGLVALLVAGLWFARRGN